MFRFLFEEDIYRSYFDLQFKNNFADFNYKMNRLLQYHRKYKNSKIEIVFRKGQKRPLGGVFRYTVFNPFCRAPLTDTGENVQKWTRVYSTRR